MSPENEQPSHLPIKGELLGRQANEGWSNDPEGTDKDVFAPVEAIPHTLGSEFGVNPDKPSEDDSKEIQPDYKTPTLDAEEHGYTGEPATEPIGDKHQMSDGVVRPQEHELGGQALNGISTDKDKGSAELTDSAG